MQEYKQSLESDRARRMGGLEKGKSPKDKKRKRSSKDKKKKSSKDKKVRYFKKG